MSPVRIAASFFVAALSSSLLRPSPAVAGDAGDPGGSETPPVRPAYRSLRFEEDWSRVSEFRDGGDPFDPLKRVPLAAGGSIWVGFGGQARLRLEAWDGFNFGADAGGGAPFSGPDRDAFLLTRLLAHADLHLGPHARVFLQGKSAFALDRDLLGGRRTIDVDELDLQNGFLELAAPLAVEGAALAVRAGRQELLFGSERLVSPLDWTNSRRTFDGVSAPARFSEWAIAPFWARPVVVEKYRFDRVGDDQDFGGVFAAGVIPSTEAKLDLYWLYLRRDAVTFNGTADVPTAFNGTSGREDRHTLGGRVGGKIPSTSFDAELEGAYQFGRLGPGHIDAFMVSLVGGYTADRAPWTPRFFAGLDIASGDEAPGGDVQTFHQLFPLGHAYLGWIDQVGRQNVIDAYPGITLKPARWLTLDVHAHFFWRAERSDGAYNAAGVRYRAPGPGLSAEIGQEIDVLARMQIDRHASIAAGYSRFFAGDAIEESGPSEDIDFGYLAAQYTF